MIIYFEHLLMLFTILSPVWASIIYFLPLHGKKWFYTTILILPLTILIAVNPIFVPKVTFWLHYYGLFAIIYILLIGHKTRFQKFNIALSLAILMLFIAGDLWEIPQFIYDFAFNHNGNPDPLFVVSQIRRVYTFAVFVLFIQLSGIKLNGYFLSLLGIAVSWCFVLLLPPMTLFPEQPSVIRVMFLSLFGLGIYLSDWRGNSLVCSKP